MLKKKPSLTVLIILAFLCLYSCGVTTKSAVKQISEEEVFVYEPLELEEEKYTNIQGALPRLQAMICGKYMQLTLSRDPEKKKYSPWRTRDGEDSMMIYQIPIGDHHKVGYWIYHYQFLTSLPNQPIYQAFSKMEVVNRDTIKAVYYEVPDGFKLDFNQKVSAIKASLEEIKWDKLKEKDEEVVFYERQNLIKYKGHSILRPYTKAKEEYYVRDFYIVGYNETLFGLEFFNKKGQSLVKNPAEKLLKVAAVNPSLY